MEYYRYDYSVPEQHCPVMPVDACFRKILKSISEDPGILPVFLIVRQSHERLEVFRGLLVGRRQRHTR
jgi:hypothetical protein